MKSKYTANQVSVSGNSLNVDGINLYYEVVGSGKPLLLLHGFGGSTKNWHPFIEYFAPHFKLILVDLPGHGYSSNMQPEFTHRQSANIISSLMDRLKIEHFNAMGMSSGGMILLHLAVNQPSRINSMILISATHYFPEQAKAIMRRASYRTLPAEVLAMYQSCATRGEEQIRDLIGQFNAFGNSVDDMNLTTAELSTINSRVLIIHGERDQFFPIEIQKEIADSIKNSELIIFANGEHVPVFEHQASFVAAAHRFLLERQ